MNRTISLPLVLAASMLGHEAQAQSSWNFDRGATQISFVGHRFGAVVTNGRFERYDGTFAIDFDHPERSRIKVTLDTASIKAGSTLVDGFITGASMLDSAKYPTATFVSDGVTRTGEHGLEIRGRLTIKGMTHPFQVRVMIDGDVDKVRRGDALPFRASGSFLRPVYDIGRDVNVVDDQIDIEIKGQLAR
ncbi:YceI family protein [Bosea thiooxidans]